MCNVIGNRGTAMIFLFKMFENRIKLTKKSEGKFETGDMSPYAKNMFRSLIILSNQLNGLKGRLTLRSHIATSNDN
jgi:hypothetical protein